MVTDSIAARIESERKSLLDLTLRNPLLNYRLRPARGVEAVGESPILVFDILVRQQKKLSFRPATADESMPAGEGHAPAPRKPAGGRRGRQGQSGCIPLLTLVAATVLMAAAACDSNDEEGRAAQDAATAAPTAESGAPALPLDTPAPASGAVPGEMETAARKLLADELDVEAEDFRLDSAEGVGWSDASLGCPQEGMAYAQVLTPGYKLVFDLAGTSYAVHTNADGSHMVICQDGQ